MATAARAAAADAWWDRLAEATDEERHVFVMEALLDELTTLCRGLTDDDLLELGSITHTVNPNAIVVEVFSPVFREIPARVPGSVPNFSAKAVSPREFD